MTAKFFNDVAARRFAGLALLLGMIFPAPVFSQSNVTYRTPNRWLLIVETSGAMQPRAEAVAQIAGNLVLSGMNGQLRGGDSIGVWTFNSSLHAGEFPLQTWTPENAKSLAPNLAMFIARQKFEGRPGRDSIFPAISRVVSNSEFITVILITSGHETFSGTPFDKAINAIHQQWLTPQEKARQPFVTMLRAQHGRIGDFEVGRPPGPLEFPPLPMELLITNPVAAASPPLMPVIVPPPQIVSNLIVHGKKTERVEEIISNPAPVMIVPTNIALSADWKSNPPAPAVASKLGVKPAATNGETSTASSNSTPHSPVAAAVQDSGRGKTFLLPGMIAAGAAVGLAWWLIRRSRPRAGASLITRSLERDKE